MLKAFMHSPALRVAAAFGVGGAAFSIGNLLLARQRACVTIATSASFAAAPWGLVGVIYAISAGWLIRCFIASWLSLPHLRQDRTLA
jgi:hypothetical protein